MLRQKHRPMSSPYKMHTNARRGRKDLLIDLSGIGPGPVKTFMKSSYGAWVVPNLKHQCIGNIRSGLFKNSREGRSRSPAALQPKFFQLSVGLFYHHFVNSCKNRSCCFSLGFSFPSTGPSVGDTPHFHLTPALSWFLLQCAHMSQLHPVSGVT